MEITTRTAALTAAFSTAHTAARATAHAAQSVAQPAAQSAVVCATAHTMAYTSAHAAPCSTAPRSTAGSRGISTRAAEKRGKDSQGSKGPKDPWGKNPAKLYEREELPGTMSQFTLHQAGTVNPSQHVALFREQDCLTPLDRADIVRPMLPYGATVCLWLAAWIWIGGEFPATLDVVTPTHYQSDAYNRALRMHCRRVENRDVAILHRLHVATPVCTACDIACLDVADDEAACKQHATVATLMNECAITPQACIHALHNNPHATGHPSAVQMFRVMRAAEQECAIQSRRRERRKAEFRPSAVVGMPQREKRGAARESKPGVGLGLGAEPRPGTELDPVHGSGLNPAHGPAYGSVHEPAHELLWIGMK